jgi:exodeoxyribonuclease VII small subunit
MTSSIPQSETNQTPVSELTYEQAFAELEAIVAILETDKRTLDETLALFERGQELARYCAGQLDQAELKVQQISGGTFTEFTQGTSPQGPADQL